MILLVAKEQMRYAITMEAAAADEVGKDMSLVASKREDKSYSDMSKPDK